MPVGEQLRKRGHSVPQFDGRLQLPTGWELFWDAPCVIGGELTLMVEALLTSISA